MNLAQLSQYVTQQVEDHKEQLPHITLQICNSFIEQMIKTLKSCHLVKNLSRSTVRKTLYTAKLPWSSHEHNIIDLCFPAHIGPLGVDSFVPWRVHDQTISNECASKLSMLRIMPAAAEPVVMPVKSYNSLTSLASSPVAASPAYTYAKPSDCFKETREHLKTDTFDGVLHIRIIIQSKKDYNFLQEKYEAQHDLFLVGFTGLLNHWIQNESIDWESPFNATKLSSQQHYKILPENVKISVSETPTTTRLEHDDELKTLKIWRQTKHTVQSSDLNILIVHDQLAQSISNNESDINQNKPDTLFSTIQSFYSCILHFVQPRLYPRPILSNHDMAQQFKLLDSDTGCELHDSVVNMVDELQYITSMDSMNLDHRIMYLWGSDDAGRAFVIHHACQLAGVVVLQSPILLAKIHSEICLQIIKVANQKAPNVIIILSGKYSNHVLSTNSNLSCMVQKHALYVPFPHFMQKQMCIQTQLSKCADQSSMISIVNEAMDMFQNISTVTLIDVIRRWYNPTHKTLFRFVELLTQTQDQIDTLQQGHLKRIAKVRPFICISSDKWHSQIFSKTPIRNTSSETNFTVSYYVELAKNTIQWVRFGKRLCPKNQNLLWWTQ
ncbi:hypothetical protein BDEG_21545 [Batrachochytrium dendrobatidis JEL423]|uniref:Uncharacterized protein n=1 Tax=Batrachochytrium dendrobatidis (strain JEL423) TaxID=403673 RepID=A0A177WCS9_BATDL|nr:hypothetical protein BDEG_21545 [Batrachochytrium dendrobatidis JEL423]